MQSLKPVRSRPLTVGEYHSLLAGLTGAPRLLAAVSWWSAARVGDVRRVGPENLQLDLKTDAATVHARILYTEGKGAHFWGPYTVHFTLPKSEAVALAEYARNKTGEKYLFSLKDQSILSSAIARYEDCSLRSIRRGSLVFFADMGADERQLELLSGHRHRDTLLRYLGWGMFSSEAHAAAEARQALIDADLQGGGRHPTFVGPNAGFNTVKGRRTMAPPELFPLRTPSAAELGIEDCPEEDCRNWPLHVKDEIKPMESDVSFFLQKINDPQLRQVFSGAYSFISDPKRLGVHWHPLAPRQLPRTAFSPQQWRRMWQGAKCKPVRMCDDGTLRQVANDGSVGEPLKIRSVAKGFPVCQQAKKRWRPVFEPLTNKSVPKEMLPVLKYPSRRYRRARVAACKLRVQFDFSAWFDQIAILAETEEYFFCLAKPTALEINGKDETFSLFTLTRCPMGASFAPGLMQTLTWAILEPLTTPGSRFQDKIYVATMIDNVLIGATDDAKEHQELFAEAVAVFLERCDQFGAQLNDNEVLPRTRDDILRAGRLGYESMTFLGEEYSRDEVANTSRSLTKLRKAFEHLQSSAPASHRNVASCIGLANWAAHTMQISIRDHFDVLRLFRDVSLSAVTKKWDTPFPLSATQLSALGGMIGSILQHKPIVPSYPEPFHEPSQARFDAIIIVDASATGFGGYVYVTGLKQIFLFQRGWHHVMQHSAWAEPKAATLIVRHLRSLFPYLRSLAVVSDHRALATGQRRPLSGNGGFSSAFPLNDFFATLYGDGGDHHVFYVEGECNVADTPSRTTVIGDTAWRFELAPPGFVFPSLSAFSHPYAASTLAARSWWSV